MGLFGSFKHGARLLFWDGPMEAPAKAERQADGTWDLDKLRVKRSGDAKLMERAVPVFALTAICVAVAFGFAPASPDPRGGAPGPGEVVLGGLKIGAVGLPDPERVLKGGEVLAVTFAAIGLWIGFRQWRDARHEASLEKYYERLDLANRRMETIYAARRTKDGGPAYLPGLGPLRGEVLDVLRRGHTPEAMWVFTELDNLEYVLAKYQLGYASPEMMDRALDTFASRCQRVRFFAESAGVGVGREVGSGFLKITRDVVEAVVRDVRFVEPGAPQAFAVPEVVPVATALAEAGRALTRTSIAFTEGAPAGVALALAEAGRALTAASAAIPGPHRPMPLV